MNFVTSSFSKTSDDLKYLFKQAVKHSSNRLKENYEDIPDHLVYSIIYGPDPIGCSLLQDRPIYNGMGRVLSRLYFPAPAAGGLAHKNYVHSDGLRPEIYEMLNQQVELGRKLGIEDFFMSREDKTPIIMKKIHRGMVKLGYDWKIDTENKYYTTEKSKQWIIWTGQNYLTQT